MIMQLGLACENRACGHTKFDHFSTVPSTITLLYGYKTFTVCLALYDLSSNKVYFVPTCLDFAGLCSHLELLIKLVSKFPVGRAANRGEQLGKFTLACKGPCYIIKRSRYFNRTVTLIQQSGRNSVDNCDRLCEKGSYSTRI